MYRPSKKNVVMMVLFLAGATISGCMGEDGIAGVDGVDGRAFTALTWAYAPLSLSMDDPAIPSVVVRDRWYQTSPGTYRLAYTAWDGSRWSATYTIKIIKGTPGTPGTPGGWFWKRGKDGVDGEDGYDLYYTIGLWSSGPDITVSSNEIVPPIIPAAELAQAPRADVTLRVGEASVDRTMRNWTSPSRANGIEEKEYRHGSWQITFSSWRSQETVR